ncbi:MAG: flagellar motor switch protein FliN [Planctomycetota bacterium]
MSDTQKDAGPAESNLERAIDAAAEAVAVHTSALDELTGAAPEGDGLGLASLRDVPVEVTVHVGRARLTLGELVKLTPGSLLELDREAHEPADILVNGKVVAHGEIVTIDDCYGVRVTSVD